MGMSYTFDLDLAACVFTQINQSGGGAEELAYFLSGSSVLGQVLLVRHF